MAAKAWSTQQKPVEEIFFQNDAVSLCLLVHRRRKTMRVIDFRAGPSNAKRRLVLSLAQREGVEKVYTLVERDEVGTWVKLGFAKEGNIPGFYKRSDAFLLGATVKEAIRMPVQSEMRLAVSEPDRDEDDEVVVEKTENPHQILCERTLAHAKRIVKDLVNRPLPNAKVAPARDAEVKKHLAQALKTGRALTAFEPFGRDVERRFFLVTARGGFELIASTEQQACFGNAFLELLTGPKTDNEKLATVSALRAMCDKLLSEGVVSCFSLAPSDDLGLATAFVFNGFRRTGLLVNHMVVGGQRKDAIIWSRKLANPADE